MQPNVQKTLGLTLAILLCGTGIAQAQIFKWVSSDGKVHYGDRPAAPPLVAEKKGLAGNVVDSNDLPFALGEAKKNAPVALYTTQKCAACDEGRKLLSSRGIPFSEITVTTSADIATLGGKEAELPQLTIGAAKLSGLDSAAWQSRLSSAGYPESSQLPKTYRNPPPVAASPAATPGTAVEGASVSPGTKPARAAPASQSETTLPGLRF